MQGHSKNPALGSTADRSMLWSDVRVLLALAAPIIGITMSRMLMGFADFYQVSFLGTSATAAISPATMFVFTGLCAGMGIVTSVQTFASQAIGRGDRGTASAYAWQAIYVAFMSIPLALGLSFASRYVWEYLAIWAKTPDDIVRMEIEYSQVAFLSVPFGVACAGLEGFFNGVQKPGVALKAIIAALICNIVGNYALIFGHFGFPAMGITGAAIATLVGWGLRIAILLFVFLSVEFHRQYQTRSAWRFDFSKLRGVVKIGGPTAAQWVLDVGAWFLFLAVIMQGFGTETLAASNIGIQYMHVAFMPAIGVGVALCSQVGHAIGEGVPQVARRKTRAGLLISVLYMGFIGLIFLVIPRPLMMLVSSDPLVIQVGVGVLIWAALFQVSDALCIIYINALRGAGDTRWPAIVLVLLVWVVFLLGGYLLATFVPQWKHHGPWMMCTLYITILSVLLWRRFTGDAWQRINLFRRDPATDAANVQIDSHPEASVETAGVSP